MSAATTNPRESQLRACCAELHRRVLDGEHCRAEVYLEAYPDLGADVETALDLIYHEYLARCQRDEVPEAEEYFTRFPQWREAIWHQLQVHSLIGDDSAVRVIPRQPTLRAADAARPWRTNPENFEILNEIGRGKMGVVYRAWQKDIRRVVALKLILARALSSTTELARFRQEATAIGRLVHPNIVQIYRNHEWEGCPYLVLEHVDGDPLVRTWHGMPQPPAAVAALVQTLAGAVQYAHERDVVHRDLRPGNVLLTREGAPKIIDFGLAKLMGVDDVVSLAGQVLGTPSYMAPEQAAGRNADVGPAADVYGLGGVLYEGLTGRPPFLGETVLETLKLVVDEEPVPPRRIQAGVPRDLETICLKCLHKAPARRYASAGALAEDLRRYLTGEPIQARRVRPVERVWLWCARNPLAAKLVLALLVALTVGVSLVTWSWLGQLQAQGDAELARQVAVAAQAEQSRLEIEKKAADAEKIAAQRAAEPQMLDRLLSQSRECMVRPVPGWTACATEDLRRAAALPPATERMPELLSGLAVCLAGLDVRLVSTAGEGLNASRLAFDPQGRWLAIGETQTNPLLLGRCRVLLLDARTGAVAQRLSYDPALALKNDGTTSLVFSPDGRWLVVGTRSGKLHRWDLMQKDPSAHTWTGHKDNVSRVHFSPDGKSLYSLHSDRTLKRWDTAADGAWAEATSVLLSGPFGQFAVSPESDWLVYPDSDQFHFVTADTLKPIRNTIAARGNRLALSPNGRTLALELNREISLVDVEAGKIVRVLKSPNGGPAHDEDVTDLNFSPDGVLLATASEWSHQVRLWDVSSGRLLADWTVGEGTAQVAFRADGRGLAVCTDAGTLLYELRRPEILTTAAVSPRPFTGFALHPDGKHLMCLGEAVNHLMELSWWESAGVKPKARWHIKRERGVPACPLAIAADGKRMACVSASGVDCWNLEAGSIGPTLGTAETGLLQFAPDGRLWSATSHVIDAWELPRPLPVLSWKNSFAQIMTGRGKVNALAVGKKWAVVACRDGVGHLLRCQDASAEFRFDANVDCALRSAALSPSETWAALGTEKGEVLLFDLRSGALVIRMTPHSRSVTALAFLSDELLVSGSSDRSVRLTTIQGLVATELLSLASSGPVRQIAFLPHEGVLAVLAQDEGAVRLWHLYQLWPQLKKLAPAAILPPLPTAAPPAVMVPKLPPVGTAHDAPVFLRKMADPETVMLATVAATR